MKNYKKIISLAIAFFIMITLTGCNIGGVNFYTSGSAGFFNVFRIGDKSCSGSEFKVYMANYQNIYGTYNDVSLFDDSKVKETAEDGIKKAVLANLTQVYGLCQYAKDEGIELTSDEQRVCKDAAKEYYDTLTKEERRYTKVNQNKLQKMYENYVLAKKVYTQLMNSVDEEVSEDEARMMDAYVMMVEDKSTAKKVERQLKDGASFERISGTYSKLDTAKQTFGRDVYPDEVNDVAFRLENDEVSDMIPTDQGYYFVYCVSKYNKEKSEANKANVIAKRKAKLVEDIVSKQDEKYYCELNKRQYKNLKINTSEKITTDRFFLIIDSYISYK